MKRSLVDIAVSVEYARLFRLGQGSESSRFAKTMNDSSFLLALPENQKKIMECQKRLKDFFEKNKGAK